MRAPWMQQNSELVKSTENCFQDSLEEKRSMTMRRHLALIALALCCCCLIHQGSSAAADASFPPELKVKQDTRAAPPSCGADDQAAVLAGEVEEAGDGGGAGGRMDLQLEDYPGSGANDRHSPWGMERRN